MNANMKKLYRNIEGVLLEAHVVTKDESDAIARVGTRKERVWGRHVVDLCEYAMEKMRREGIENQEAVAICELGVTIAKTDTH